MIRFRHVFILFLTGLIAGCASTAETSATEKSNQARLERMSKEYPSSGSENKKLSKQLELLSSEEAQKRAWAAYNIGKVRGVNSKAIKQLIAILGDNTETTMERYVGNNFNTSTVTTPADEAAKSLARIGRAAVNPLLAELNNKNVVVQQKVIKALGLIKPDKAIKPLVKKLSDKNPKIRLAAASALGRYRGPWVADALLASLTHTNAKIRASAAYALGNIRDPLAFNSLVKLLNDVSIDVQSQAMNAIVKYGYNTAIPVLLKKLQSPGNTDVPELIYNLGSLRDYRVIEKLIPLVESKNEAIRMAAVDSLQQISGQNFGFNKAQWRSWWNNKLKRAQQGKRQIRITR